MRATVKIIPRPTPERPRVYTWEVIHLGKLVGDYSTRSKAREVARAIRRQEREHDNTNQTQNQSC